MSERCAGAPGQGEARSEFGLATTGSQTRCLTCSRINATVRPHTIRHSACSKRRQQQRGDTRLCRAQPDAPPPICGRRNSKAHPNTVGRITKHVRARVAYCGAQQLTPNNNDVSVLAGVRVLRHTCVGPSRAATTSTSSETTPSSATTPPNSATTQFSATTSVSAATPISATTISRRNYFNFCAIKYCNYVSACSYYA